MCRIITFANRKGGSGKTTLAVNLAAELSLHKQRVLLIDLDPQCHASYISGINTYERKIGMSAVLKNQTSIQSIIRRMPYDLYDVAPLYQRELGYNFTFDIDSNLDLLHSVKSNYDFILIDTPPSIEDIHRLSLSISTDVWIPMVLHFLAMEGLAQLTRLIYLIAEKFNPELRLSAIVPIHLNSRTNHEREVLDELHKTFGKELIKEGISTDVKLADASWEQKPLCIYFPKSRSIDDFRRLANELLGQENTI